MKNTCAVCQEPITEGTAEPYRLGAVRGCICARCAPSMETAIATWMRKRMREVETERLRERKLERARQEREASATLAKEVSLARMAQLALEGLPIATRSEVARSRRSSAA